ncbi:hypothetical protein FJ365_05890 [Candidatus Dependentiae bacterium]|nr:hypothetical protein [Candidatus Dependentiae bacterium]
MNSKKVGMFLLTLLLMISMAQVVGKPLQGDVFLPDKSALCVMENSSEQVSVLSNTLSWFQIAEKMSEAVYRLLVIECAQCHKRTFSCSELAGHAIAAGWSTEFDKLKDMFAAVQKGADTQQIVAYMIALANAKAISCVWCKKWEKWI